MQGFDYRHGDLVLSGLLARPDGAAKAAVALYPTIMNATPAVVAKAEALARAGHLVLICDFYGETPTTLEEAFHLAQPFADSAQLFRDRVDCGLRALMSLAAADGLPLWAMGFCMGGRAVLELARMERPLEAAISFHGLLAPLDDRRPAPGGVRPDILIFHGDADTLVPRQHVIDFWAEMDACKARWNFHSYSGVPHGFTNPTAPDGSASPFYDREADMRSWAATMTYLDDRFG